MKAKNDNLSIRGRAYGEIRGIPQMLQGMNNFGVILCFFDPIFQALFFTSALV